MCDKVFSIQSDEATDSNNCYLITDIRFCDSNQQVKSYFSKLIEYRPTALALFKIINHFRNEASIQLTNSAEICTDGARTMYESLQIALKIQLFSTPYKDMVAEHLALAFYCEARFSTLSLSVNTWNENFLG